MSDRTTQHTAGGSVLLAYPPCPPWCDLQHTPSGCRGHHYADIAEQEIDGGAAVVEVSVSRDGGFQGSPSKAPSVRIDCQGDLGQPAPCLEPCCLGDRPPYGVLPSADLHLSLAQTAELAKLLTAAGGPAWLIEALQRAGAVFDQDGAQR
jgi:hypothetical protein